VCKGSDTLDTMVSRRGCKVVLGQRMSPGIACFFVEAALCRVLEVLLRQRVPGGSIKETAGVLRIIQLPEETRHCVTAGVCVY